MLVVRRDEITVGEKVRVGGEEIEKVDKFNWKEVTRWLLEGRTRRISNEEKW